MSQVIKVNFKHPANAGILPCLKARWDEWDEADLLRPPLSTSPDDVEEPYIRLGTHPDVVTRLWNELAESLPERCAWVVYGTPVLVQPASGIIFGMGSGVPTYALRLPEQARSEAVGQGAKTVWTYNDAWLKGLGREHNTVLDLASWGPEWVFGDWLPDECNWCLMAYHYAASVDLGTMP